MLLLVPPSVSRSTAVVRSAVLVVHDEVWAAPSSVRSRSIDSGRTARAGRPSCGRPRQPASACHGPRASQQFGFGVGDEALLRMLERCCRLSFGRDGG